MNVARTLFLHLLVSAFVYSAPIHPPDSAYKPTNGMHHHLTYPSLYEVCLSWKAPSSIHNRFCRRIEIDNALALQAQATITIDSAAPPEDTILLALSSQQGSDKARARHHVSSKARNMISERYKASRNRMGVLLFRMGGVAAVMVEWIASLDERIMIALLASSWVIQVALMCLLANDYIKVSFVCRHEVLPN